MNKENPFVRLPVFILFFLLTIPLACSAQEGSSPGVRKAAYQGSWYPDSREELLRTITGYLHAARLPETNGKIIALLSPHAGYRYSGPCAAHAYRSIMGKEYHRVFLLGFSHHYPIRGAAVSVFDFYETPLGQVRVDRTICEKLGKKETFSTNRMAEEQEHSIEMQLPFLQSVLKDFSIIPLLVGELGSEKEYQAVAAALKEFIDDRTLVIVSSDLTHYGKNFAFLPFTDNEKENLRALDAGAILRITNPDFNGFREYLKKTGDTICGERPLSLLLTLLDKSAKGILLKYYTSGDLVGDYSSSVSYAAIAFVSTASEPKKGRTGSPRPDDPQKIPSQAVSSEPTGGEYNAEERKRLLKLARETIVSRLTGKALPEDIIGQLKSFEKMTQMRGVFVTIRKREELRGCIGYIQGVKPLYQAAMDNAISASTRDYRFPPMTAAEINDVRLEISVMSPLRKIQSVDEIVVGRHGLYIEHGGKHGILLPQVATEEGWNREEFLDAVCRKAGLPEKTWQTAHPTLWIFSAEVFGEE